MSNEGAKLLEAQYNALEERYRLQGAELAKVRQENSQLQKDNRWLVEEVDRLRRKREENNTAGRKRIPDEEFVLIIERIQKAHQDARQKRLLDARTAMPPRLSVLSVARALNIADSAIYITYPHIVTLVRHHQGKDADDEINKLKQRNLRLSSEAKALRDQLTARKALIVNMANHLYRQWLERNPGRAARLLEEMPERRLHLVKARAEGKAAQSKKKP